MGMKRSDSSAWAAMAGVHGVMARFDGMSSVELWFARVTTTTRYGYPEKRSRREGNGSGEGQPRGSLSSGHEDRAPAERKPGNTPYTSTQQPNQHDDSVERSNVELGARFGGLRRGEACARWRRGSRRRSALYFPPWERAGGEEESEAKAVGWCRLERS
jgi:hypothetical protein